MKRVYDMCTGEVLETLYAPGRTHEMDLGMTAIELRLQPVASESAPKRGIPPELVLADLNAFIEKMR